MSRAGHKRRKYESIALRLSPFVMRYSTNEIEVKTSLKLSSFFFRGITRRTYPCKKESRRFCIYVNRAIVDRACAIAVLKNARCYERSTLRTIRPSPSTSSLTTLAGGAITPKNRANLPVHKYIT